MTGSLFPDLDFDGDVDTDPSPASTTERRMFPEFDLGDEDVSSVPSASGPSTDRIQLHLPPPPPQQQQQQQQQPREKGPVLSTFKSDPGIIASRGGRSTVPAARGPAEVLHLPALAQADSGPQRPSRTTRPQREWRVAKRVMMAVAFKKGGEQRRQLEDEILALSSADESGADNRRRDPDWRQRVPAVPAVTTVTTAEGQPRGQPGQPGREPGQLGQAVGATSKNGSVTARSVFSAEDEDFMEALADL